jgi:hypothetical protein
VKDNRALCLDSPLGVWTNKEKNKDRQVMKGAKVYYQILHSTATLNALTPGKVLFPTELLKYRWFIDEEEELDTNEITPIKHTKFYKSKKRKEEKKMRYNIRKKLKKKEKKLEEREKKPPDISNRLMKRVLDVAYGWTVVGNNKAE